MEENGRKKKSVWKIILICLSLYILGKGFGYIAGKQQAKNEGYLTGNDLKEVYKKSHIEGCIKKGTSEEICSCTFDGLIEQIGVSGYTKMGKIFMENGMESPEAEGYVKLMTEEILKCR
jgi:hypothetical protein